MSKVAVVTDSTAYIPDELLKQYNITVAPQILIWGDETFQDGWIFSPTNSIVAYPPPKSCPPPRRYPLLL